MANSPNSLVRGTRALLPTLRYWSQTEAHVYAFSVSAGLLLSFFPFLIVMLSLCHYVFKWKAAVDAVYYALDDYFPDVFSHFLRRNFEMAVMTRGPEVISLVLLFFTSSGIFVPLEVAFNRIWNCPSNRSYLRNQLISLGLIFSCGALILLSVTLTAQASQYFTVGKQSLAAAILFKLAAVPISMLMLFLIYWLLPNCKIKPLEILPAAVGVGFLLEGLKYINLLTWPYLRAKLALEYGPFVYTITIIIWGFLAAMVVLAGAEWTARRHAASAEGELCPLESSTQLDTASQ